MEAMLSFHDDKNRKRQFEIFFGLKLIICVIELFLWMRCERADSELN